MMEEIGVLTRVFVEKCVGLVLDDEELGGGFYVTETKAKQGVSKEGKFCRHFT